MLRRVQTERRIQEELCTFTQEAARQIYLGRQKIFPNLTSPFANHIPQIVSARSLKCIVSIFYSRHE